MNFRFLFSFLKVYVLVHGFVLFFQTSIKHFRASFYAFSRIHGQMFDRGVSNICYRHHLNQAYHEAVTPMKRVPACRADIR